MSEIKKETTQDAVKQLGAYKTGKLAELVSRISAQKASAEALLATVRSRRAVLYAAEEAKRLEEERRAEETVPASETEERAAAAPAEEKKAAPVREEESVKEAESKEETLEESAQAEESASDAPAEPQPVREKATPPAEEKPVEPQPEKKAASALLANDVVLRTRSSKSIISQISRSSNDDHETALGTARAWRAPIEKARKRGVPDSEIIERIHSRLPDGRSYQTVRAWVVGQDRIAPRSVEDLRAIFAAFGERPSEEQISEMAKAARKIRGQHQRAGAFLKEELVKAFLDDVHLYGIENALNGFHGRHNIGYVELLKVSAVGERANVAAERVEVI